MSTATYPELVVAYDPDPIPGCAEFVSGPRVIDLDALAEGAGETPTAGQRALFDFLRFDHLGGACETLDFVERLLISGGASLLYGPSNLGKTFWIVDVGAAVASNRYFRGDLQVERGAVIYVALEGSIGARNRVAALRREGLLKDGDPFFLIFDPVSLMEPCHADKLAATVAEVANESGLPVRLVIIDTMARAMAGGDENSGSDMTLAVKSIDAVRAATGAHVCVVHHCGKDVLRGARGHSSLRAAVDTELEISRADGDTFSVVRVTKQRDLPIGEPMPFTLKVVTLGIDRRGNPITSCVVHHEDASMAARPEKSGRDKVATVEHVLDELATGAMRRDALIYNLMKKCRCSKRSAETAISNSRLGLLVSDYLEAPPAGGRKQLWFILTEHMEGDAK